MNLGQYTVRIAAVYESELVLIFLKNIARWMKVNNIKQWQYLLEGGDDPEIILSIIKGETYVVEEGNNLVATFTISPYQSEWDEHIFGKDEVNNSLYLHRIAIHTSYMKKGLGSEILNWIFVHFAGKKEWLKLDCVSSNLKLSSFYRNNGFEEIGITDGHRKFVKKL